MSKHQFHVAIVGGGLCGVSLAIALTKRGIPYTIYEARSSFSEIGAGINLAANTFQAFDLIDPSLADTISALATRGPAGKECVWMSIRLGAPTDRFGDAEQVMDILSPPTGNMTLSRSELLRTMAERLDEKDQAFNKKLIDIVQSDDGATLFFEDGTQDVASLVIGCDGAHSALRRLTLGSDDPATEAKYSEAGCYRAVLTRAQCEQAIGVETARAGHIWTGPGGYIITYPIEGGTKANVGVWIWKKGEWGHEEWILPNQKDAMLKDFVAWGQTAQSLLRTMTDDTHFWAAYDHSEKPESYHDRRVCIIGDASHAMVPHQGQGAAQAMEDACVMAEALHNIDPLHSKNILSEQIEAALAGYESVRRPRFESVLDSSHDAMKLWSDFWRPDLTEQDLEQFRERAYAKFKWIWDADIAGQCERAKSEMQGILNKYATAQA